jgi:hypothetical protein
MVVEVEDLDAGANENKGRRLRGKEHVEDAGLVSREIGEERTTEIVEGKDREFEAARGVADDEGVVRDMAGQQEVVGEGLADGVILASVKRTRRRDQILMRVDGVDGTDRAGPKAEAVGLRKTE